MTDRDMLRDRLDDIEAATGEKEQFRYRVVFRDPDTGDVSNVFDTHGDTNPGKETP